MQRRHDLDWVRVCAFGLLVLFHIAMYYVNWDWHVKSPHATQALEPWMFLSVPWRLALLFLISGVATSFLLDKGRDGFLRQRSWRLLLPLAVGMFVIVPPQTWYEFVAKAGFAGGYVEFYGLYLSGRVCIGDACIITPTWNHLWFVAYLWVYTVLLHALSVLVPGWLQRVRGGLSRLLSGAGVLVWPALLLALARLLLVERFPQTHALVDDMYNHAQYFSVFLLGFLVARADGVWATIGRARWVALVLWACTWLAFVSYVGYYVELAPPQWLRLAMRATWGVNQWCAIVAVLGFARQLAPGDSPALRYLTSAVFPVYILHQTLIIALSQAMLPLALPAGVEAPLLVVATFGLSFAGYEVVRRVPFLRPLFGLKRRPQASSPARCLRSAR